MRAWALLLLLPACAALKNGAGEVREHRPLLEQIVRMRPGHKGLTHQTCISFNYWGDCTASTLIEYDLADKATRQRFVENLFVCRIGGRRFKIDPDAPQFVRYQRKRPWFLAPEETKIIEAVPAAATQRLLDGRTECWSEKAYPSGIH